MMRKGKAESLGALLKNVVTGLGKKRLTQDEIREVWKNTLGKRASSHTLPVALKRGSLVVNVDVSAWLYELTMKRREILKKLDSKIKGNKIKGIRFRIGEVKQG